jgi:isorenieratene synthase
MPQAEIPNTQYPISARPIIIGGGIAGLTAALHLAERGLHPLVLEADERCGGRLKGGADVILNHAGQTWRFGTEHGVHGIWSPYRNLQTMWARHRIRPVLVPAREEEWVLGAGRIVHRANVGSAIRESWVPAPFHYLGMFARPRFLAMVTLLDVFAMAAVLGGLLAALSIDPLGEEQPLKGMTLADFCRGWTPTLVAFFAGLARNAFPEDPKDMPASGFVAFLRFYTLRRRDAWAFSYLPTNGGTSVIEPMVRVLQSLGGEVITRARVTRLEKQPDGWRVAWERGGESQSAQAVHVVLAVDAPAAESLLRTSPDTSEGAARLNLPRGRRTAIVRLWFDVAPRSTLAEAGILTGDFALHNFFWLHRIYNEYIRWHRDTGGSALEAHIYGPPELFDQPDANLLARAIVDVNRAWPELKGHLIHSALSRNDATHTLFQVGLPDEHLGVVTPWPHLFCCGDWVRGRNSAMFLERACVTGILAANAVLQGLGLEEWPVLTHPQPEWLAGQIESIMYQIRKSMRRS